MSGPESWGHNPIKIKHQTIQIKIQTQRRSKLYSRSSFGLMLHFDLIKILTWCHQWLLCWPAYTEQTIRITDLFEDILALITSLTQWVVWWFVFQKILSHAKPKSNPSLSFFYFQNSFWFFTWLKYFLCLWLSCTKWSNQWTMNDAKTKNVWIILRQLITKKDLANLCWRAQGPIVTHEKSKVKIWRMWYVLSGESCRLFIYLCNKNPINTMAFCSYLISEGS